MVLFTFVITAANLLLWLATRKTIALQVKSNYSDNHQMLVTGHRDLYIGLLHQPELFGQFAKANGLESEAWKLKIVSAFLINQVFIHYLNFMNGTIDRVYLEGLKQDAQDVFAMPTVQEYWQEARVFYAPDFEDFIENELKINPVD